MTSGTHALAGLRGALGFRAAATGSKARRPRARGRGGRGRCPVGG